MKHRHALLLPLLLTLAQVSDAGVVDIDELSLFFEEIDLIELATKHPQSIREAPATATVITADEIKKMGVRTIHEVLRRAANFDINTSPYGKYQIEIRGIQNAGNNKIRFMIDGFTVQDELTQSASWIFDSLSLHNIKRIEVIRGPASALYGTSAFAGIVNIITFSGRDIDGTTASIGYGSFNTKKANIVIGGESDGIEYALSVDSYHTDGEPLYIEEDKAHNSGDTDHWKEQLDLGAKLSYGGWRINSHYLEKRRGPYVGMHHEVNDESEMTLAQYFVELRHKYAINDQLNQTSIIYYNKVDQFNQYWYQPSTDQYINDRAKMEAYGAQLQFDYQATKNHLVTVGSELEHRELYDAEFYISFTGPTGTMVSYTDLPISNWIDDTKTQRDIWAIYLQDIWQATDSLEFTFGIRHDEYSDFGSNHSPKVAAVWQLSERWDLKALYSKGFKAPNFAELYIQAGVQKGNTDLKAETTDSYEVSLSHQMPRNHVLRVTYFKVYLDDRILPSLTGGIATNTDGTVTEGIELEWKKYWGRHTLYANYTYQDARYQESNRRLEDISDHKGNVGTNLTLSRHYNLNVNVFARSEKPRVEGDTRNNLDGFIVTDVTLIAANYIPNLELRFNINNLFDAEYDDPSPLDATVSDHPREGRSYMMDLSYRF